MKKIIALVIMAILPAIAGCGGGGGGAHIPTAAVMKISATPGTLPVGGKIGGIGVTIELPAGVTVKTNAAGVVDPSVVVASGVLAGTGAASFGPITFIPATSSAKAKLDFTVASTAVNGVGEGEYVTINFTLSGVSPTATDFTLLNFVATGLPLFDTLPVTAVKTVTLS